MSIIIVSFNTREMTLACLRSVAQETKAHSWEVLFIDNKSSDGSFEAIESEFGSDSRFVLKKSTENLGFAGGNNYMVSQAKGRFLLLLNPDTVVLDGALDKLVDFAIAHPENKIWGGRTIFEDGSLNPTNCWGSHTLWTVFCANFGLRALFPKSRIFDSRCYGGWQRDSVREVATVTGCLFLITHETWSELGGFDPEFFMYGEEVDLCLRATAQGARPIITPDATIIHHDGASDPIAEEKLVKVLDGEVRLFRRHFSPLLYWFVLRMIIFGVWFRAMVFNAHNLIPGTRNSSKWLNIWKRRAEWTRGSIVKAQ